MISDCFTFVFKFSISKTGAKFLDDAILADIIDYDEFLTGQRSEATYTMFKSFLPKICAIPAAAIPLALLNVFGHVPPINGRIQRQPDVIATYCQVVTVVIPTLASLAATYFKWKFPLRTKEQCDMIGSGVGKHLLGKIKSSMAIQKNGHFEFNRELILFFLYFCFCPSNVTRQQCT